MAENQNARPRTTGYSEAGASIKRRALKGFTAVSSSPNEDINWNQYRLRQRGRMLYMSYPVAASAINVNRTKVIGTGLCLKSSIDAAKLGISPDAAKEWQRKTESEFEMWANKRENCDATGMNNFAGIQQLAVMSWLTNGDVFALFQRYNATRNNPYSLRIHMIEADRVCTPHMATALIGGTSTDGRNKDNGNPIYDGVEVDANGMVVAYHVCSIYPHQQLRATNKLEWQRVEAYGKRTGLPNILHILSTERPDQYRGVTYLAPVIESLLNISRYTQSELMAALVQSFFTAWIYTDTNPAELPFDEVGYGDDGAESEDSDVSQMSNEYEMGPGTVLHLKKGEKVDFGNPNIPSVGFESFVRVLCREAGAALEIPYDTLLKEFNASYSASRAALMEAWEAFKMRRKRTVDMLCQPVYEVWLAEAVAIGRINAPGFFIDPAIRAAWCRAEWNGPVQGQLDPVKEVKADILAVSKGFKTHEQVTRENGGGNWQDNVEQLKTENAALKDAGGPSEDTENIINEPEEPEKPEGGTDNAKK